ncbi:TIGR03032 family protein [Microbacteriaceae bacterium K1510]|nr:TIGR03032 family protein [Microbacteriaceae bacterium K1510]
MSPSFHERFFARAMGLWADQQRILRATLFSLWRLENVLGPEQSTSEDADCHYVPRVAHTTGDLDIHDVAVMTDGRIVFVSTSYSCLATLSPVHPFSNGLEATFHFEAGHRRIVAISTALPCETARLPMSPLCAKATWSTAGVIAVTTDATVSDKLSMPHRPRLYDGKLWVLNSDTGYLGTVDLASGEFVPHAFIPAYDMRPQPEC